MILINIFLTTAEVNYVQCVYDVNSIETIDKYYYMMLAMFYGVCFYEGVHKSSVHVHYH